jgi:hypothetical protein
MAYASFVHLPLWRDRPPSYAFFDFNRYEYRLQLCPAGRPWRYCGQHMPGNICYLHNFRDGDFRRDEELELGAIYTGADYIVGQMVGHEDTSGRPAWILIWDTGPHQGVAGRSNARVCRRVRLPDLVRTLCALCHSLSVQSEALGVIVTHTRTMSMPSGALALGALVADV